jgi:hypothetical protein
MVVCFIFNGLTFLQPQNAMKPWEFNKTYAYRTLAAFQDLCNSNTLRVQGTNQDARSLHAVYDHQGGRLEREV